ncbi:MAG: ABC transporter ATP-binding protein [Thermoanaerobaculia bacterium]
MSAGLAVRSLGWTVGSRRILGPVDLDVAEGGCLAVVGPNGAGKTTLLRSVAGVLEPSGGSVAWRGEDLLTLPPRARARRLAYVPQVRPARVPLSVEQLVLLGRYPHLSRWRLGLRREDFEAARRAADWVGVGHLLASPLDELSGGERQAAYLAAALAQETELLVLDEPTAHLDARHQRALAQLVLRLRGESTRTVLLASHDLNLASMAADVVVALKAGRIFAHGTPAEVLVPEVLRDVFEAPFTVVRGGERPVTLLELGG